MNKQTNYKNGDKNQKYQGDISIVSNIVLKDGLKFEPLKNSFVVAEGETTGHKHCLIPMAESQMEIANDGTGFYLRVISGSANLVHEEHDTITKFGEGLHYIGRQWEFSEQEEYKIVRD